MEHSFLEGGFYVSAWEVGIFCKNSHLILRLQMQDSEVNHFLLGTLFATVCLDVSSVGQMAKLMCQHQRIKFFNQLNKMSLK